MPIILSIDWLPISFLKIVQYHGFIQIRAVTNFDAIVIRGWYNPDKNKKGIKYFTSIN